MKSMRLLLILTVGLAVWFAGCEVNNPGSPADNQPPTTILSVAPTDSDTVSHYLSLRWAGNDPDGSVVGFRLLVDEAQIAYTAVRETTLAFTAPSNGVPVLHTFEVLAVDNEGLADTNHTARRLFYTVNYAPTASFDESGTIDPGAVVGPGFRFTIAATDSNLSLLYYTISLDDTLHWIPWVRDTAAFVFADPVVIADTATRPPDVVVLPNTELDAGAHTLYARVKDAGEALSPIISLSFTVADTFRPVMEEAVTATYGGDDFYLDGSTYHTELPGTEAIIVFSASSAAYSGEINAYRHRLEGDDWSPWHTEALLTATDLSIGGYRYEFMARDLAGATSDTGSFLIRLVVQSLSDSILVVDETRDGTGSAGSPDDAQVDAFYDALFAGEKYRQLDYATHQINLTSYVSPYDVCNCGLVVWHADDRANLALGDNKPILEEFLNKGGRLILSGWDVLSPFGIGAGDSMVYEAGSFARDKLRLLKAYRNTPRTTTGFSGSGDFPGCRVDSAKVPGSWNGMLDKCWAFSPRGECTIVGRLTTSDTTNVLAGKPAASLYELSFRVAVFGVPLYFCRDADAAALMAVVLPRMMQGLGGSY